MGLVIAIRWTIWNDDNGNFLHVQIPGHAGSRPYGAILDVHKSKEGILESVVVKNDTQSLNDKTKKYSTGSMVFDGSPYVTLHLDTDLYVPVPFALYTWLYAEAAQQDITF
jgi:hypothetical protein